MIVFITLFIALLFLPQTVHAVSLNIADIVVDATTITMAASVSGATANYYLQGAIRAVDSSRYFGETKNNRGDWIDYISSPEKEYIVGNFFQTDVRDATWSGRMEMRFKVDDLNYKGPGDYEVKLRRYTGGSTSSAGDSNTLIVSLSAPLPTPSPSPSLAPSQLPAPSQVVVSPTPSLTLSPTPSPARTPVSLPTPSRNEEKMPLEGTVAGVVDVDLSAFGASPSPTPLRSPQTSAVNRDNAKVVIMIGSGIVIAAGAMICLYRLTHKL